MNLQFIAHPLYFLVTGQIMGIEPTLLDPQTNTLPNELYLPKYSLRGLNPCLHRERMLCHHHLHVHLGYAKRKAMMGTFMVLNKNITLILILIQAPLQTFFKKLVEFSKGTKQRTLLLILIEYHTEGNKGHQKISYIRSSLRYCVHPLFIR